MSSLYLLAWGATFLAIALMTYGLALTLGERYKIRKRMEAPKARPAIAIMRGEETVHPIKRRLLDWLSFSGQWALKDEEEETGVRALLIHGGFRHPNAPAIFYGIKAMSGLLLPVPFLIFLIAHDKLNTITVAAAFLLAGVSYFLPQLFLQMRVARRQDKIDKALPDVIDLMIICMEAGLALQASMNRVADEIKGVCREFYAELQLTGGEMRAGLSRDVALRNLGRRTGVKSVQSLVTLMIQSDKMGSSIGQALRVHAEFSRAQRALKAEERAAKIPVKMVLALIMFILPTIFVVTAGPAIIIMFKSLAPLMQGKIGMH
jgi:tight adherence protein C